MAGRKSKLNSEECKQVITSYFQKQKKFNQIQSQFNEFKTKFYNDMEEYFESNDIGGKLTIDCDSVDEVSSFTVTRVQNTKIEFNPEKLEKVLGKELSHLVIQKKYEVIDMHGLVSFLKGCGVNPKIFKSFIAVHKTVNMKELEKLEELGKITAEQIKGCYTVKNQNPYFKVSIGRGQNE